MEDKRKAKEAKERCISMGCLWTIEQWQRVRASGCYDEEQYRAWAEWMTYKNEE